MTMQETTSDAEADAFDYEAPIAGVADLETAVKHAEYAAYWQERIIEIADAYDAEDARLRAKLDGLHERRQHEVGKLTSKLEFHRAHIAEYHRRVLSDNPRRKTLDLVHGSSSATVYVKPHVSITDKAALLEWAAVKRPDLIEMTPRVPHAALIDAVAVLDDMTVLDAELGEPVPGVSAAVSPTKFTFDHDPNGPF